MRRDFYAAFVSANAALVGTQYYRIIESALRSRDARCRPKLHNCDDLDSALHYLHSVRRPLHLVIIDDDLGLATEHLGVACDRIAAQATAYGNTALLLNGAAEVQLANLRRRAKLKVMTGKPPDGNK